MNVSPGTSARHRGPLVPRLSTQEIEANTRATEVALALVAQAETSGRRAVASGFHLCAVCRAQLVAADICAHHTALREHERADGWAAGNRIWCEFVHGSWRTRQGRATAPTTQGPVAGGSE
jgi:hypothetical protein